jgi:hypothetical protein
VTEREFGNFSTWSRKELIEKERSFTAGDRRRVELQAEIDRRIAAQGRRVKPIRLAVAILGGLAAIVTIALALDHGIYLGSTTTTSTQAPIAGIERTITHKMCRYLFITGVAELPALGGFKDTPGYAIDENPPRPLPEANALHCRLFAP